MSAFVYKHNEVFDGPSIHMPPSCIICFTYIIICIICFTTLQCLARIHNTLHREVDTKNKCQDVEFFSVVASNTVPTNHHEEVHLSRRPTVEHNCILYCNPPLAI